MLSYHKRSLHSKTTSTIPHSGCDDIFSNRFGQSARSIRSVNLIFLVLSLGKTRLTKMHVQTKFCRIAFQPKLGQFFKTAVLALEMDGYFDNDNGQTLFLDGIMMDIGIVGIGKYDENLLPQLWFIFTEELTQPKGFLRCCQYTPNLQGLTSLSALISKYWVVPLVVLQKGPPPLRGSWEPHTSPL